MDKIWWNEQWMGWLVGIQYQQSSNVYYAYKLQGKLMLVAGEREHNVDPFSSFKHPIGSSLLYTDQVTTASDDSPPASGDT